MKRLMFKQTVLITILFFSITGFAKNNHTGPLRKNAVSLEIGGSGGIYSINYGHIFYERSVVRVRGSFGLSIMPIQLYDATHLYPVFPLKMSVLAGKSPHFLEVGLGYSPYLGYVYDTKVNDQFVGGQWVHKPQYKKKFHNSLFPEIGYFFQKSNSPYFFRVTFTPLIYDNKFCFLPWGGIGLGFRF